MSNGPYGYCKHGQYVGGCGADLMCGACESGDVDPTPAELAADLLATVGRLTHLIGCVAAGGSTPKVIARCIESTNNAVGRAHARLVEARQWAVTDNDDDWTGRRYRAACDEYEASVERCKGCGDREDRYSSYNSFIAHAERCEADHKEEVAA